MPQSNIDKGNRNKNYKESEKSVNMIFCVIAKISSFRRIHRAKTNNS